jgi:hypothetical protein
MSEMNPAAAAMARSLRAERPTPTLRQIADRLAQADHRASTGKPYAPSVVARMVRDGRKRQKKGFQEQASARAFD